MGEGSLSYKALEEGPRVSSLSGRTGPYLEGSYCKTERIKKEQLSPSLYLIDSDALKMEARGLIYTGFEKSDTGKVEIQPERKREDSSHRTRTLAI
ncbi:hypothetical protein AVEN_7759-1 [Araneus ventricosus]|uniref:Uncharacterized protein n=1 Tax=Araneus ventricosus TaxID=182803 RepID=A0A4Y2G206_ARAVE|nr:hypothetical protein AVEN_7759-1 [Araneus ventricosus]